MKIFFFFENLAFLGSKAIAVKNLGLRIKPSIGSHTKSCKAYFTFFNHFLLDSSETFKITFEYYNTSLLKNLWCRKVF
jgi:hypothetical protein